MKTRGIVTVSHRLYPCAGCGMLRREGVPCCPPPLETYTDKQLLGSLLWVWVRAMLLCTLIIVGLVWWRW
jgi:hypothetical protein